MGKQKKHKIRYQDMIDSQRNGEVNAVFIDDTGSPGLMNTPSHLDPERKSWVGVIIPKTKISEVWHEMPGVIKEVNKWSEVRELHFTDIYQGKKEFKNISDDKRLGIFAAFAHIFYTYEFPVYVQTLDSKSLRNIQERAPFPDKLGPFNLKRPYDTALFILLIRIKAFLEGLNNIHNQTTHVFIDEGYKKNGIGIRIPFDTHVFYKDLICFAKSDRILPLQLADCAAFCMNRQQILIGKHPLSNFDIKFLQLIEPMVNNFRNLDKKFLEIPISCKKPKGI